MNAEFVAELKMKAKRTGVTLNDLFEEQDPSNTGKMHVSKFRKIVAECNIYLDDDKFLDIVQPYCSGSSFNYIQFIKDNEKQETITPKITDDQLREFGGPLRDRQVDLIDFLRAWDRSRTGRVSQDIFLRKVSSTPLAQSICKQYTNQITGDVEYITLANDISRALSSKPEPPRIQQQDLYNNPEFRSKISSIAEAIAVQGISLRTIFTRLDRCRHGWILPSQFMSEANNWNIPLTPSNLKEISDAFTTPEGYFDYSTFTQTIESALKEQQEQLRIKMSQKPAKKVDLEGVLLRIMDEIQARHSQIGSLIADADTEKNGIIPENRFGRLIQAEFGSLINDEELHAIINQFSNGKGGIDYIKFLDIVYPVEAPPVKIEDLLIRLQDHLAARRVQLKPILSKYGKNVPYSRLQSTLRTLGFDMTEVENSALKQSFASKSSETIGESVVDVDDICSLVDPQIEQPKPKPPPPKFEQIQPAQVALDIMTRLAALSMKFQQNIKSFFVSLDPRHTGHVPVPAFKQVLQQLSVSITEKEIDILADFYFSIASNAVNYENFCNDMIEFGGRRIQQNPKIADTVLKQSLKPPGNPEEAIHKIKLFIQKGNRGGSEKLVNTFRQYDNDGSGFISRSRLESIFRSVGIVVGDTLNENEFVDVSEAFKDQRLPERFSYVRFMDALGAQIVSKEDMQTINVDTKKVTTDPDVIRITEMFREKLQARHKRIRMPFNGMNPNGISNKDFRRCLESFGLIIREADMQKVLREYKINIQGDIDWMRFCTDVENNKTI